MRMQNLYSILLIVHITGGAAGLISGSIAASVKKGSSIHRLSGKVFFFGMLLASISALIISWLPEHNNIFLFAVGGFTLYMITTGYRIIYIKRKFKQAKPVFAFLDYLIFFFGLVFGLFLLLLSVLGLYKGNSFALIPGVFGLISLNYARMDYDLLTGKRSVAGGWMSGHIIRMMGALIASYTAFLVVNVQIGYPWILWLLPTITGGYLIRYFLKKYLPKKG